MDNKVPQSANLFYVPFGRVPASATNADIGLKAAAGWNLAVIGALLHRDGTAGGLLTPKRVTGTDAALGGTAVTPIPASGASARFTAKHSLGAAGTAVDTFPAIPVPPNTVPALTLGEDNIYIEQTLPGGSWSFQFTGVGTDTKKITIVVNGTDSLEIIADAGGTLTDSGSTFYYAPGASATASATAIEAKIRAAFQARNIPTPTVSRSTDTVTIGEIFGGGMKITNITEDDANISTPALADQQWLTFTASWTSAGEELYGWLLVAEWRSQQR